LLLPLLRETPGRIVNVSSGSHYSAKSIPYERFRDKTWSLTGMKEYEISKLCNVLFTKSLAKDEANKGITTYSLHPGTIATDIWRNVPSVIFPLLKWAMRMKTVEEGAQTTVYCATSNACATENGLYYTDSKVKTPSRLARDPALADELWKKSAELVSL
jgi:NAD(P)-dependent dehydrogenase (short-subunit alcohol dehydrogenase family)